MNSFASNAYVDVGIGLNDSVNRETRKGFPVASAFKLRLDGRINRRRKASLGRKAREREKRDMTTTTTTTTTGWYQHGGSHFDPQGSDEFLVAELLRTGSAWFGGALFTLTRRGRVRVKFNVGRTMTDPRLSRVAKALIGAGFEPRPYWVIMARCEATSRDYDSRGCALSHLHGPFLDECSAPVRTPVTADEVSEWAGYNCYV